MAREQTQLFHQNVKAEMEEMLAIELPHVENIGFTTEEWQSKSGKTSLLLSIHYVNQRFQLWKFAVACWSTEGFTENNRSVLLQLMINDVPGLRNQDHCSGTVVGDIRMNKKKLDTEAIHHQVQIARDFL